MRTRYNRCIIRLCASLLTSICLPPFSFPPLHREPNAPDNPGPAAGCLFYTFSCLAFFLPMYCMTSFFPSCLPSSRSLVFKFFSFSCRLACFLPDLSFRILVSACLLYVDLSLACMLGLASGCVGNLIVIPYYSNYLYSTLNLPSS